jgi:gamma-butyrobetaine dioxygenase
MATNPVSVSKLCFDQDTRRLLIDWDDGRRGIFPYIWLRHAQFFPLMGRSEQHDAQEFRLPEDATTLSIDTATLEAETVVIHWAQDDSVTRHALLTLHDACLSSDARQVRHHSPRLWLAQDASQFHRFEATDLEQPQRRLELFNHLRDFGIALISGLPVVAGTLESVARYFGPVRQTHFGSLFDIRSKPEDRTGSGQNIGSTAANSQAPHTDEGWRHGPPGINFFHCLRSHADGGGASIFVDGIGAAEALRSSDPNAFELLATVPLLFVAERNPEERFRSRARVIALDNDGEIRGIRITDRTLPALDLPVEQIESAYHALGQFYKLLLMPKHVFEHLLQPGELVIFDNHRVLHGRRAFDPQTSERWLQQLSVDREEFHSRFRQLAEAQGRSDLSQWDQDAGALS